MLHFFKRSDGPVVSLPLPVAILERRSRRPRWRTFVSPTCLVVALLLLLFLAGGEAVRWGWDDTFYRAQTSSLVEDGDVDLRDDVLGAPADPTLVLRVLTSLEPRGTLNNDFPVGSALLWMPAYAAGRVADLAAAAPVRRWSEAQALALYLVSLGLALAVLFFLERWLRFAGCPRGWSTATALLLLLGTPLGFYAVNQYAMAHLGATAAVCLVLAALVELERRPTAWSAAGVGVALGFCALLRFQDALLAFALLPPLLAIARREDWRRAANLAAWAAGAGFVVVNLQVLAWWRERGELFSVPQGEGFIAWSSPALWPFLTSGVAGVALWAPLMLAGMAGLLWPWRSRLPRSWRWSLLAVLALEVWVSAAALDWWAGASFGPRRLTSMVPLLAVGLANLLANVFGGQPVAARRRRLPVAAAMAGLAAWAVLTTFLFAGGVRDLGPLLWGKATSIDAVATGVPPVDRARSLARLAELPRAADHLAGHLAHTGAAWFEPSALPTFAAVVVLLALAIWSARRLPRRPALAVALGGVTLLAVGAEARLLTGAAPPSDAELTTWRSRVRAFQVGESSAPPPPAASAPTNPDARWRDAHLVLSAFTDLRRGQSGRAEASLGELAGRQYPIVDAALAAFAYAAATGHELVGWAPGRWFDPAREGRHKPRVFTVPHGPLRVSFSLTGTWGEFPRAYRLLRISSPATGSADLVADGATLHLEAPGQLASAPLPRTPCTFELELDATGRLEARCGASRLAAKLAPPVESPTAEPLYLVFGQQMRRAETRSPGPHPMGDRAFSDLEVKRRRPGG